jgi:hypothetical protein
LIRGDASDWIDCFRGTATPQAERLDALPVSELLLISDLTLTEVLQGFGSQRDFDQAWKLLTGLDAVDIGGRDIAIQAARNDRTALQRPRLRPICHTSRAEFGDELNRAEVEEGGEIRGNVAASPIIVRL